MGADPLLIDHPYNREVPAHTHPRRVHDWRDIHMEVERLPPLAALTH